MQNIKLSGRSNARPTFRLPAHQVSNAVARSARPVPQRWSGSFEAPKDMFQAQIPRPKPTRLATPAPAQGTDPWTGLVDAVLQAAMKKAYHEGKKTIDYSEARRIIFSQLDNINGIVTCWYTGRQLRTNQPPKPENMNVEHILPQSKGSKGEAKSDFNHLAPTDYQANEKRGNLPYGYVVNVQWEKGGTKVGLDAHGNEVCEVRDAFKGNVARAMFNASTEYSIVMDDDQEAVLREWAKKDPVDDAERMRSASIAQIQGSGNPFVSYPWLVDRVKNF